MKSVAEIRARRDGLVAKAARQRAALAVDGAALQEPAQWIARGLCVLDWLRQRPLLVGIAAVAVVVAKPRAVLKTVARGLVAWRAIRTLRGFLKEASVSL